VSGPPPGDEQYCYVTTIGRVTGEPREIEIWFVLLARTAYLLAGGGERANWVRNLRREPQASVRIRAQSLETRAREPGPGPESDRARRALFEKYSTPRSDLARWRDHGLLVALDLKWK
jgi:deazaflavin-dependent oxidoreductase (nitroreductase family)